MHFLNVCVQVCVYVIPALKFTIPYKSTKCPIPNQASKSFKGHFRKCTGLGNKMTVFNSSPSVWGSPSQKLLVVLKSAVDDRYCLQSLQSGWNCMTGLGYTELTRMALSIYPAAGSPSEFLTWRPMMPDVSRDLDLQGVFSLPTYISKGQ